MLSYSFYNGSCIYSISRTNLYCRHCLAEFIPGTFHFRVWTVEEGSRPAAGAMLCKAASYLLQRYVELC